MSSNLAAGLRDVGVRKGDRVAVSLGNNVEYAAVCVVFRCEWSAGPVDGLTGVADYVCAFQAGRCLGMWSCLFAMMGSLVR